MSDFGNQNAFFNLAVFAVPWVVRDGDVAALQEPGAVPEPAVVSLMFAGMGAVGVAARRRRRGDGPRGAA